MDINKLSLNEIWQRIEEKANENPAFNDYMNQTYAFNLTGEDGGEFGLVFTNGFVKVIYGEVVNPDCSLRMNVASFKRLLLGELNSATAFMMGQLKVTGNITLALKLEKLLKKYAITMK